MLVGSAFHFRLLNHARFLMITANLSMEMTWRVLANLWTRPLQNDVYNQFASTMKVFLRMEFSLANRPIVVNGSLPGARCPACTPISNAFSGTLVRVSFWVLGLIVVHRHWHISRLPMDTFPLHIENAPEIGMHHLDCMMHSSAHPTKLSPPRPPYQAQTAAVTSLPPVPTLHRIKGMTSPEYLEAFADTERLIKYLVCSYKIERVTALFLITAAMLQHISDLLFL